MNNANDAQPLGDFVPDWTPPPKPSGALLLDGAYVRLEALNAERHAALLFRSFDGQDEIWSYLPDAPFSSAAQYHRWAREAETYPNAQFMAVYNKDSGAYEGTQSLLNIAPATGSIELGYITFSPALQQTRAATEAMYLGMKWAFEAGYRRFEWKCNALNRPSRRAAQRLGLSYEGVFRKHMVVKGRNRDTAWFAAIDSEWPGLKEAFTVWLAPSNFDADGAQIERLSDLTSLVRSGSDPTL